MNKNKKVNRKIEGNISIEYMNDIIKISSTVSFILNVKLRNLNLRLPVQEGTNDFEIKEFFYTCYTWNNKFYFVRILNSALL